MTGTIKILDTATVTLEDGFIGLNSEDSASETGTYIIDSSATIMLLSYDAESGEYTETTIDTSSPEALAEVVGFYVNPETGKMNLVLNRDDGTYIAYSVHAVIWNEGTTVSAVLPVAGGPTALLEEALTDEERAVLVAEGETALYAGNLSFDKAYEGTFTLRFHLGEEYIGKTVEVRRIDEDGNVVVEEVLVNAMGNAIVSTDALGAYAVVAK